MRACVARCQARRLIYGVARLSRLRAMDFGVHKKYWVGPSQRSLGARSPRVPSGAPRAREGLFLPANGRILSKPPREAREGTPEGERAPRDRALSRHFRKVQTQEEFGVASSSSLESEGAGVASWPRALIPRARITAARVWYFFKVKSDFLAALLNPRGIMECLAIVFLGCAVSVFRLSGQPPRQAGRKRPYAGLINECSYDSPPPSIAHLSDISARPARLFWPGKFCPLKSTQALPALTAIPQNM